MLLPDRKAEDPKRPLTKLPDNPLEGTIELDGEERQVIYDYFQNMRYHPVAAGVLKCKGQACKYIGKCPLVKINRVPEPNSDCPIEAALIQMWITDLTVELRAKPNDTIDQAQIRQLVSLRMYDKRVMEQLAEEDMIILSFRSMALDGTPLFEERVNPLLGELEKNHRMADRVLQSLIATREAKSKEGVRDLTAAEHMADLTTRIQVFMDAKRKKESVTGDIIEVDAKVVTRDAKKKPE